MIPVWWAWQRKVLADVTPTHRDLVELGLAAPSVSPLAAELTLLPPPPVTPALEQFVWQRGGNAIGHTLRGLWQ